MPSRLAIAFASVLVLALAVGLGSGCIRPQREAPSYPEGLQVGARVGSMTLTNSNETMLWGYVVTDLRGQWVRLAEPDTDRFMWINLDNVVICWFNPAE